MVPPSEYVRTTSPVPFEPTRQYEPHAAVRPKVVVPAFSETMSPTLIRATSFAPTVKVRTSVEPSPEAAKSKEPAASLTGK